MPVRAELLGLTQPVLSISLEPGESIVAQTADFAWLTDSIQLAAGPHGLSAYTAAGAAGTVAFAARLPGSIVPVDVTPTQGYLIRPQAFLAGTPGVELAGSLPLGPSGDPAGSDFVLRCIAGRGRAWVEMCGEVVRRELAAGTSLRTRPWHVGMADCSVTVQLAPVRPGAADAGLFAVLSGPGSVWLQSTTLPASPGAFHPDNEKDNR